MTRAALGRTGLSVPRVVFGTSSLGNLYRALPFESKRAIVAECLARVSPPVVFDSAGKYGAGLALESLGRALRELGAAAADVLISNKLGWMRVPLRGAEPSFEPGAWKDLAHDAEQRFDYDGILACWRQGNELLGPGYSAGLVSVHDPDEYLALAAGATDRRGRFARVLDAYRALGELRSRGEARGVGVGSKDWTVIRELADSVDLDWVMLACSLTIYRHPPDLLTFVERLRERGVGIVNSAVFNAGFLTGGEFFDYRRPDPVADRGLFAWRERFLALCAHHDVSPSAACVQFALSPPGISAVALNTSRAERVADNVALVEAEVPPRFWTALKDAGLVSRGYPYLG
jgi:D-threo-aldose 1-dehydrogenase